MKDEAKRTCDFCGKEPADERYREVVGLEQLRAGGGANKIIGRRETGRYPCFTCARKIERGIPLGQQTLL